MAAETAWRCGVCGYIHRGAQPPEVCPVCGAASSDFEAHDEPAAAAPAPVRQWQCLNCNYVHDGERPPDECPVCGAAADRFEPVLPLAPSAAGGAETGNVVIVGGGIAGVSAAEAVRKAALNATVTIVAEEPGVPYYRLNLTRLLAGEIERTSLPIHPAAWYEQNGIALLDGVTVSALDLAARQVRLADGRALPYDQLVLAMGSHPFVPPLPGAELEGVHSLRTAEDARLILERAAAGAPVVCIGGGVLGIEAAGALARRGADVTLLESHDWLMPRQLNREGGDRLEKHLQAAGVRLRRRARTARLRGERRVEGVELEGGEVLPAGLVVLATGVRPNTHLARRAGLEVNKGVVVNNHLQTSQPGVYAAGDVAEHNGVLYGVWGASQYQGSIAGLNAAGVPTAFGGLPRSNTLKILDVDVVSLGQIEAPDGSYVVLDHCTESQYVHAVFHDGRLAGALLMGVPGLGAAAKKAIESGRDFSAFLAAAPTGETVVEALRA